MAFTPDIDTGQTGGSMGPWMYWSSNGSAMKGLPHSSWILRGKEANGDKFETAIPAFANGCVLDLDTLKLGWEKDTPNGPERRWNATLSVFPPRPSDEKKSGGGYAWTKSLSIRCAIGGGQAATWEQGSFGAYEAFAEVLKEITGQWAALSQNGALLPLVQQVSVRRIELKSGAANLPVLSVVKWVPRPDCLKADAPAIATTPAPVPAARLTPAAPPPQAPAAGVPADIAF